jgi:hypothetical protein
MNTTLEVRLMPLAELVPAAYNPRRELPATAPAYRKLKASLERFGLVEPLVWNELTGRVVGGHLRLRILAELGTAAVPVSVVRLTEAAEKALNLVLNNREAQGRPDAAKLADILAELQPLPEFADTGYELGTLAALRMVPSDAPPPAAAVEHVTVVLTATADAFARMEPRLDALIREFELTAHVRGS